MSTVAVEPRSSYSCLSTGMLLDLDAKQGFSILGPGDNLMAILYIFKCRLPLMHLFRLRAD